MHHFRKVEDGFYRYGPFDVERDDSNKGYCYHWTARHSQMNISFFARTRKKLKEKMDGYLKNEKS